MVPTSSVFESQMKVAPIGYYSSEAILNMDTKTIIIDEDAVNCGTEKTAKMEKPLKTQVCKVCGKILSSASSYYVHMKSHSEVKPYQCNYCDAAFCRKPYLSVHIRTHTGEKPYQCDSCDKRFTQKSSLNTHKRVHTGERPYSCDLCEKKFAVKSYVISHRWSHLASEKPLKCEDCDLNFTSKSQFMMHIRVHSHDKNYECTVCGRVFVKQSYLIRHQTRVHKNEEMMFNVSGEETDIFPGSCVESQLSN